MRIKGRKSILNQWVSPVLALIMVTLFLNYSIQNGQIILTYLCFLYIVLLLSAPFLPSTRIVLEDHRIHEYFLYPWRKKTYHLQNLHCINRLSSGTFRLEFIDGKIINIPPDVLDFDSQALWEYITQRVPEKCYVLSAPSIIKPRFNRQNLIFFITLGLILPVIVIFVWKAIFPSVFEETLPVFFHPEPNAVFVNADGVVWSIDQPLFSKDYRISRYEHGETQSWNGLSLPALSPEEMEKEGNVSRMVEIIAGLGLKNSEKIKPIISIGSDSSGNPVLIYRQQLYHWDGQTWQSTAIDLDQVLEPDDASYYLSNKEYTLLYDAIRPELRVAGQEIWYVNPSLNRVERIDLNDGSKTGFPFPKEDGREGSVRDELYCLNGTVYAGAYYPEFTKVYKLYEGVWQELFQFSHNGKFWAKFTVDAQENVWFLIRSDDHQASVGKYSPETQQEEWFSLDGSNLWNNFYMDRLGRLWARSIFNGLFVFELSGEKYIPIRNYTKYNSNLPAHIEEEHFWVSADGMLRVFDYPGKLFSLDTSQPILPKPTMDVFAKILEWGDRNLSWIVFLVMVGFAFLMWRLLKALA